MTHEAKPTPDLRKRAEELAGAHVMQFGQGCVEAGRCSCGQAERVKGIEKLLEHQDWPLLLAAPLQKYQEQDPNAAEFAGEAIRVVRERIEAARSEGRKAGLEEGAKIADTCLEHGCMDHLPKLLRDEAIRAFAGKEDE